MEMTLTEASHISSLFRRAKLTRRKWEGLWQECFDYTQPHKISRQTGVADVGSKKHNNLFDSTACDAVEQLAASLLAELAPPWSDWFGLKAGDGRDENAELSLELGYISEIVRGTIDRSNLSVELHQAFLDLVTVGTSCLLVRQAEPGSSNPIEFSTIPVSELFVEGDQNGGVRRVFRHFPADLDYIRTRFPRKFLEIEAQQTLDPNAHQSLYITEMFENNSMGCDYAAIGELDGKPCALLDQGHFAESPVMLFRWSKSAGEVFGRSPVMTALADIKTANKVVELILKNASISVTGIWLAEDDGILNPRNIRLTPGTIIPKAVGSKGLTPLEAPGRFDVSQIVLNDLRQKIRHTLLVDKLGAMNDQKMTATEVIERSAETSRLLGAVFGRVQGELITPLLRRTVGILQRKGIIPSFEIGPSSVEIDYRSPLARAQARTDVSNGLLWLNSISSLGPEASEYIDQRQIISWLAKSLGIPLDLIKTPDEEVTQLIHEVLEQSNG